MRRFLRVIYVSIIGYSISQNDNSNGTRIHRNDILARRRFRTTITPLLRSIYRTFAISIEATIEMTIGGALDRARRISRSEGVDDAYDSERFDTPETVSIVIQSTSGDPTRETGHARRYTRSPWARLDRVSRQSM